MKFSPSNNQFFPEDFGYQDHAIPDDAVEVPEEDCIAAMQRAPGATLALEHGRVVILPAPAEEPAEHSAALERFWRSQQLMRTDNLVARHRDELERAGKTTLSAERYSALQSYRQALRQWPQSGVFPLSEHRPPAPSWLADAIQ